MKEEKIKESIIKESIIKEEAIKKEDKGLDAFILSIISILSVFFWYICFPTSIYALVRGVLAVKKSGHSLSKTAFIISLIALTICVALYTQAIFAIIQ